MGIGVSILLIAVGAVLVWGVTQDADGLNVDAIGVILMIVGLAGLLISLFFWESWGRSFRGGARRRSTYVEGDAGYVAPAAPAAPVAQRRVDVVEEDVPPPPGAPGPPPPP
jgi:hypothetical protein